MSELDDLRRIAYGRTSSAADEAAAADARAALARRDALTGTDRSTGEADGFAGGRGDARAPTAGTKPAASAPPTRSPDETRTDTDTDTGTATATGATTDATQPPYPRRLAASWRVWALPAGAAFLVGIAVTVASGVLFDSATRPGITPATNTSQRFLEGSELLDPDAESPDTVDPGDLGAAFELFAQPQQPDDVTEGFDSGIDATSSRLVYVSDSDEVFAAKTVAGSICLLLVNTNGDPSTTSCVSETTFTAEGVSTTAPRDDGGVLITWDGVTVTGVPTR